MSQVNKTFLELIKINNEDYIKSLNKFNKELIRFEKLFINFCTKNLKTYKWNCYSFKNKIFIEDGYIDFLQFDNCKKYIHLMYISKGWGSYHELESFYNYSFFDNCLKAYNNIYKELSYDNDSISVSIDNLLNLLKNSYEKLKYNMEELLKSYLISFRNSRLTIKNRSNQIKFNTNLINIYNNYIKGIRLVDEKILIKLLDLSGDFCYSYCDGLYNLKNKRNSKKKEYTVEIEFKYFPVLYQTKIINKVEELYNNGSIIKTL